MNAPNTAYDGAAAYKVCPTPCTPDRAERTMTCKFDGTCDKYAKWKAEYDKTRKAVQAKYSGDRDRAKMIAIKKANKKYQATVQLNKKLGNGG